MEWGDFSYLIFSSSHACLQFSPFLSILTAFLSFHSIFFRCLEVSLRSRRYRQVVQNPWGTFPASLLSFPHVLPLSAPSLFAYYPAVWHAEPCWISSFYLHCASGWYCVLELGCGQKYVWVRIRVCFVSLRENVITLQFMNLKLTWLRLPKSATLKF